MVRIGTIPVFAAGTGYIVPVPTLYIETRKSGLPFQKFFLKFYFLYFCIAIIHQPVGVVSSFAGFFRVKGQKSSIFLMLELRLVKEMRNLAIFRWFLDAFASWMRVYMFYIEKVSEIG